MGVLVVVDKVREIYFIDIIKIHLDRVKGLGSFLEIEAQSETGGLAEETLASDSYSDLLMARP